eukprot:7237686-Ditylum_brightwellii.AAC.1
MVPERADICPREKFAMLLSLIIQQYPSTILQPWNHEEHSRVITAGEDLPYEKEQLNAFAPMNGETDDYQPSGIYNATPAFTSSKVTGISWNIYTSIRCISIQQT